MPLKVLLLDPNPGRSAILEQALLDYGYEVVGRTDAPSNLPALVKSTNPDVIIVDLDSPDRDTLEHMRTISEQQPKPIVMFAEASDSQTIEKAVRAGVSAYIVDGLSGHRLKPIMDVAIARFREYQALKNELDKTKSSLEERKLVDRAKGILMKQKQCTEEQAYAMLRKAAMANNQKIVDVARNVLSVAELLGN